MERAGREESSWSGVRKVRAGGRSLAKEALNQAVSTGCACGYSVQGMLKNYRVSGGNFYFLDLLCVSFLKSRIFRTETVARSCCFCSS